MHKFEIDENGQKQYTEVKIIDFEYSGVNFRGFDLAGYIIETGINYKVGPEAEYPWTYDDARFPSFGPDGPKPGTVDVDLMVREYLTRFYENHVANLVPNYDEIPKFESL